ncbi:MULTISPECIES: recombinase family protein [Sorangium]|uniref:Serine recombinase n=1 Tax=Sorangium cellulosum TaxID=56 RepID=A0A4P2QYK5_SORCE|nr:MULTISPECIES: recombinase family protein [Sorangium]AUX35674.1 serine recombinase [Sorangium cellulosum]WCQ94975.1 integrase [Sorangium sp. Soce836]
MKPSDLPQSVVERRAVVYVRQSTGVQVHDNQESLRRQYDLAELARSYGFRDVVTIDTDLGRSASGTTERPGFQALVAQVCEGGVGAIFCLEASRLARNGRDWHHLLELCGLVGSRVIDAEGVYDPSHPDDRLLLGLKGTMSEFELTVMRQRLVEGAVSKARRGELRVAVPVGYVWSKETGLDLDPDRRVQEAVRTVFRFFSRLGSARQVLLAMCRDHILFPRPEDPKRPGRVEWRAPAYRNIIAILQSPFYAGAYVYGKSEHRTRLVDGRLHTTYGHERPMDKWTVLLREHHRGYITWARFEQNQQCLARNAFRKAAGGAKSGRGGRALLSGLLRCRRCGRMLGVTYVGRSPGVARYACRVGHTMHGLQPCITFGAPRPDLAVGRELLAAVEPLAIDAAIQAEQRARQGMSERRRALELERQQAAYEVRLAARRYEAVDPDNRLVAAELEARWNTALAHLHDCDARLAADVTEPGAVPDRATLLRLAGDLTAAWNAPTTTMAMKQRLVHALIEEIVADVDEATREVVLLIHWRGGQHSELRVRKPAPGEHNRRAPEQADQVIRSMATRWSDEHIAATLNRMGLRTGQNNFWNARNVQSYRRTAGIAAYQSAHKDGRCLTMHEAARVLKVTDHVIRKLIRQGTLPAHQVVKDAPWQIMFDDLRSPAVLEALSRRRVLYRRPCREVRGSKRRTITTT